MGIKVRIEVTWGILTGKGPEATFLGPGNALDFDLGGGYAGMYIGKNSLSCPLQSFAPP